MSEITTLSDVVAHAAEKYGIPGLAAAVWHKGTETIAAHGVTNLDHQQPVDENTLFAVGSTSKPFAATALMHLVARGEVDLDAPVRHYIPELRLPNEEWTAQITVKQLLNHTAG
ncbi:beta-lactamase family protein, partial [Actinospica sp. MGRD01-02]